MRSTAGGNITSYQLIVFWTQPRATAFVGWFVGDGLVQAIDACLKAAREAGCKLNVKKIEVIATRRQRGEV